MFPFATIEELQQGLQRGEFSPKELQENTLLYAQQCQNLFNAFIELSSGDDAFGSPHSSGSLSGIPYAVKDVICQKGRAISCGSRILQGTISPYDATVITRLAAQGAISIARANCDEFAMGSSGETSWYGPTKNPWDSTRVPGGSSSGSAVAVAAGVVPFALGSETGGSVRQPAALCGITGFKPTYGAISRYGVVAYASSIDQVGIFAHTVSDIATVFSCIAGHDEKDGTTISRDQWAIQLPRAEEIRSFLKGKKIGIVENALHAAGMNPEVQKKLTAAIKLYEEQGAIITPISLPTMELSAAIYFVVSRAEGASNLSRYDGVRFGYRTPAATTLELLHEKTREEGFGPIVQQRILIGNYVLSAGYADQYFKKAKRAQQQMKEEFYTALTHYDALFLPVSPEPAFRIGALMNNSLALDLQDYFTCAANLTGLPAIALPCGFVDDLPVGFQFMGKWGGEQELFSLAHAYQGMTEWHKKKPSFARTKGAV